MPFEFDGSKAAKAYIGSKMKRSFGKLLEAITEEEMVFCIENGKLLTDYMPEESHLQYRIQVAPYRDIVQQFTFEEAYLWLSEKHRATIEATSGGREWATRQLNTIRELLISS